MIYLDNASTTPLSQTALDTLYQVSRDSFGNPSSIHGHGRQASQTLRQARQDIARLLKAEPRQIIFTSGSSEANTLALKGYALANQDKGRHIITTAIEHHSVLHTLEKLAEEENFELTIIQPEGGQITAEQVARQLRPDTILVSVMHTNNETGLQLPIAAIGQLLIDHQAAFHVDAVQAVGKRPLAPSDLNIDLLSASAHKFHGPKGTGFLYSRVSRLRPQFYGGNQEDKRRAGTENLAAVAAMAAALEESLSSWQVHHQQAAELRNQLLAELADLDYYRNGSDQDLPYVINIGFPGQLNERLLMQLDLAGISVSSGSACTAGSIEPSHVLAALYGQDSPRLKESIRISFSSQTSPEDITACTTALHTILGD